MIPMAKKALPLVSVSLDRLIGDGQTIGTLPDGKKCLVWGGLPGEEAVIQLTKKKSHFVEGYVTEVMKPSADRIEPRDPISYLSTSPWQIMKFAAEEKYKSKLIDEAFILHRIKLPKSVEVWTDEQEYEYRNKIEFSFWYDTENENLDLAFFRRGTHSKITVRGTSLANPVINQTAQNILQSLRDVNIDGRSLKTLLIRCNREGDVAWQLYVKDIAPNWKKISKYISENLWEVRPPKSVKCGEIIFSDPRSPASVITKRLVAVGDTTLTDTILDVPFRYATEGFFQINLPVYEQTLADMKRWVVPEKPVIDLYSGVGTIGLTIAGDNVTLVEMNEHAVREMKRNIDEHGSKATAVLAASENALEYITGNATIIVDPPRAGLHEKVIEKLLEEKPRRIIYLSCNPVTQARDIALLSEMYEITWHKGYNFFPRTPHIEHLVILDCAK